MPCGRHLVYGSAIARHRADPPPRSTGNVQSDPLGRSDPTRKERKTSRLQTVDLSTRWVSGYRSAQRGLDSRTADQLLLGTSVRVMARMAYQAGQVSDRRSADDTLSPCERLLMIHNLATSSGYSLAALKPPSKSVIAAWWLVATFPWPRAPALWCRQIPPSMRQCPLGHPVPRFSAHSSVSVTVCSSSLDPTRPSHCLYLTNAGSNSLRTQDREPKVASTRVACCGSEPESSPPTVTN